MSAPKSDLEWLIQLGREGNQPHAELVERAAAELSSLILLEDAVKKIVKENKFPHPASNYNMQVDRIVQELSTALNGEKK